MWDTTSKFTTDTIPSDYIVTTIAGNGKIKRISHK